MVRLTFIFIGLVAFSGAICVPASAQAPFEDRGQRSEVRGQNFDLQTPTSDLRPPTSDGLAGSTEPDPLPGLPRPLDQPKTLFQPAPAVQGYGCPDMECPYFEQDSLLDPYCLPHPGWLFDVEMDLLKTHVESNVGNTYTPMPGIVFVPMASLNWTVSPRFEFGYRLPSGFGEVDVSYRFLVTEGVGTLPLGGAASPDAAATLRSHFSMNVGDVDYSATETSLGANWLMKWRIGMRFAGGSFDSQAVEPVGAAAAGSGIFQRSIEADFWGIGPHAALELKSRRNPWGLGWVGRLDGGLLFGQVEQKFVQVSTGGVGTEIDYPNDQQVPILSGFLGLDWRPPSRPNLDILLGSTAEYWWNVGRLSDPDIYNGDSAGEMGAYGVSLRLEYNF
jgi:hypothetical protein